MNNNQRNQGFQPGQFNQQYNRFFGNSGYPQEMMPTYMPQPQMQPSYFKGRPVVSFEEARAAQIDFDGSLYIPDGSIIFPDSNSIFCGRSYFRIHCSPPNSFLIFLYNDM